jgi:predicted dehydrogenase
MRTIRWGIIGAGNISSTMAQALNALEHTELTAIASRNLDKAQAFANKFHVKKSYGSYEELVLDPEIDVIYIGTPHTEHKANAALCIKHGKSVLCEKAFTINQTETKYLIDLAKEHKVFLMEAMWTKLLPVTKIVKEWIQDKRIGNVKYFNISFGYQAEFDPNHRLFNPKLAGGALLDVGVYPISYVIHLMDRLPDQVISSAYLGQSNVDEMNIISLLYNDGIMADLSSSITAHTGKNAVIVGDKGRIIVPTFWGAESAELYGLNDELLDTCSLPFSSNGFAYEAEEVNQCIREGKLESDAIPLQDTLEIMKLMDQMRAEWGLVYPQEMKE